jgi:hypothetical protein
MVNSITRKPIQASDVISDVDAEGNTAGAFNLEPTQGETKDTPAKEFFKSEEKAEELATELAKDLGFDCDDDMIADITTLIKLHAKTVTKEVSIEAFVTDIILTLQEIAKDDALSEDELDTGITQEMKKVQEADDALLRTFLKEEFEDIAGGKGKKLDLEDAEKISKLIGITEKEAEEYIKNNDGKIEGVVNDYVDDVFATEES